MKPRSLSFSVFCLLTCWMLSGCGVSYPYYTLDGSPESRVVVIHLSESKTEKVPAGTGMGGGLDPSLMQEIDGENVVIIEKGPAKVVMKANGPIFTVKTVEYEGKTVLYHEPLL
ncbi:MAG TPA: hypothetical protein VMM56_01325 [Planctomycetaceae bacterium]|nr:hypothetical protein [Planctomycetaceae bacterium]